MCVHICCTLSHPMSSTQHFSSPSFPRGNHFVKHSLVPPSPYAPHFFVPPFPCPPSYATGLPTFMASGNDQRAEHRAKCQNLRPTDLEVCMVLVRSQQREGGEEELRRRVPLQALHERGPAPRGSPTGVRGLGDEKVRRPFGGRVSRRHQDPPSGPTEWSPARC